MNDKRSNKMGRSASMPLPDTNRPRLTALLIAGSASLAGCSSSMMVDHLLRKGTPSRPATPAAYPAVTDPPTPRTERVLTDEEQKKLEDDLIKSRKRVQDGAKPGTVGNR